MHDKSRMMLRLLLNRYHSGLGESFLKGLPEEDIKKILSIPVNSNNILAVVKQPQDAIKNIHYSWLIAPLQNVKKDRLNLVLSLLPEPHGSKLRKILKLPSQPLILSPLAKSFFMSQFHNTFKLDEALPLEFLLETDMTMLAHLDKKEIVELIDFLGLYDLAEEIHHIVNKSLLEQIYSSLTKKKLQFLKKCLHSKEKLISQRLNLENWDGTSDKLLKILHHKGMVRLGYALSGQKQDLIWHIVHILDTGRGEKLSRYCNKESISGVTDTLKKQVKNVITFFKQTSEK